jgi:hypothetical protein
MQFAISRNSFTFTVTGIQDSAGILEIIPCRSGNGMPIEIWIKYNWFQKDMSIDATIRATSAQTASGPSVVYEDILTQTTQPTDILEHLVPNFDSNRFFYTNAPISIP